jgi:hypothetical protein
MIRSLGCCSANVCRNIFIVSVSALGIISEQVPPVSGQTALNRDYAIE